MDVVTGHTVSTNNVADYLLADKPQDCIALITTERQYTYGELRSITLMIADFLQRTGASAQDRVIIVGENDFFWVAGYLGIMKAGLVCVPLPTESKVSDLESVIAATGAHCALLQSRFAVARQTCFQGFHVLTDKAVSTWPGFASQSCLAQLCSCSSGTEDFLTDTELDELAALMFTSGTTETPRGVMVSHGNIIANTESIIEYLSLTPRDRIMAVLPFHYCFGASLLHTHLRVGGSVVLESHFVYPEKILQRMIETECTGFAGVPSHFQILLRTSGLRSKSFPRLRYIQQAGGALAPKFICELVEALPQTKIFIMYGQTEATARLSYLPPTHVLEKLGSVGKGIPGVQLRVLNEAGDEVPPGEVGEIVAEGENVTQGYWRAPEETAATIRNGALHTGDLANVDSDGFIYIVGRAKSFLKCGGKRVSTLEVKHRLLEFPCVLDAEVLAAEDEVLGEALKVVAVARMPDCNEFESCLRAFCREHLPQELCPREIIVIDQLPRASSGKATRQQLAQLGTRAICLSEYFRCPDRFAKFKTKRLSGADAGYFRFAHATCYARTNAFRPSVSPTEVLHDASVETTKVNGVGNLPFDPDEAVDNLHCERYREQPSTKGLSLESGVNEFYYCIRPLLPVSVRKYLQKLRLRDWRTIPFPRWPVDTSADDLLRELLLLSLRAGEVSQIPFIWFWPEGAPSCVMMTHDVETPVGRDFCSTLMDMDERYRVPASFQIVPEERYEVTAAYLQSITGRGFEVNVQDLNHDGRLYKNREQFLQRVARINAYGREWGAQGFRGAILYRRPEWFDSLDFSYDLSIPNVAHLDPQRGGCCTTMPYFIKKMLELPVTTIQDYSLFHILAEHSINLWKQQIELILGKNGLISFIVHPDYIVPRRERQVYESLLNHLVDLREEKRLWFARPGDVNQWWRERAALRIVKEGDELHIQGVGKERARIAYASECNGELVFSLPHNGLTPELSNSNVFHSV